ncbi:MAG: hypothetical protein IPL96_10165 [Holophagaceae bacterium]|nr:hypothetical protein [Holophagaceae bacterium]
MGPVWCDPSFLAGGFPRTDLLVLSGLTLVAAVGFRRARTCGRLEGALFLAVYLGFLVLVIKVP